jgi:mannose-6-phosphate isomerase
MGAHPKASSQLLIDGEWRKLSDIIRDYPEETIGGEIVQKYKGNLPFLFKVLSAGEPLSIQAHPGKEQAIILHKNDPINYPDENHKPEIAIALDELKALLGFKKFEEIKETVLTYPGFAENTDPEEYQNFINQADINIISNSTKLKSFYSSVIMDSLVNPGRFKSLISSIQNSINSKNYTDREEYEKLFLQMFDKYGFDIGLISILFFNLVTLKKGEAIFTPAGIPHAYIEGNIIECMANSDNVIRAGLTPKFQDIDNLLELIDYSANEPQLVKVKQESYGLRYLTTADEFEVRYIGLKSHEEINLFNTGPTILLVVAGEIELKWNYAGLYDKLFLRKGMSAFLPAQTGNFSLLSSSSSEIFLIGINN